MNERFLKGSRWFWKNAALFIRGEEAPTATEYAIMAGLIGAVVVAAVTVVGANVIPLFESVNPGLKP